MTFKKFRKQEEPVNNGTFRSYEEFLKLDESQWASRIRVCTNRAVLVEIYDKFNNIKAKELIRIQLMRLKVKVADDLKRTEFKPQINVLKAKLRKDK